LDLLQIRCVHLCRDDDRGSLREIRVVFCEFRINRAELFERIPLIRARDIDEVKQQPRSFDMSQELDTEAVAEMRPFDQTWNIRNNERLVASDGHEAELRLESGKRIICDLGPGG